MNRGKKQFVAGRCNVVKENSWYWSVLVKNTGSEKKAELAIETSRGWVDPTYIPQIKAAHKRVIKS